MSDAYSRPFTRRRPRLVADNPIERMEPDPELLIQLKRRCRECGCTDERACPGGCWWARRDLCTRCAPGGTNGTGIAA